MCKCACTYTWCCEKGHVDTTELWQAVRQSHIERTSWCNDESLSVLSPALYLPLTLQNEGPLVIQ